MAKLGLLFVAVFCLVQISMAARLLREAPTESTTSFFTDLGNKLQKGFEAGQEEFQKTFTKENFNKFLETASDAGQKLNTQIQDLAKDVSNKVSELGKDAEKKE